MAESTEINAENWLDGLDDREQIFVLEYLVDLRVERAALKAGYALTVAKSHAYTWLRDAKVKPKVFAAVQFALAMRRDHLQITADMVVSRLKALAYADMRHIAKWRANRISEADETSDGGDIITIRETTSNTVEILDSDSLDDDAAAAVKSIKQDKDGNVTVEMHNPVPALMALAKHLGIMDDRVRHLGPSGGPVEVITSEMDPQEAARLWQASIIDE